MSGKETDTSDGTNAGAEALRFFKAKVRQFEDVFAAQFPISRLKAVVTNLGGGFERVDDELLAYLRRCLTGIKGPVLQPEIPVFLNDLLAMEDFRGGMDTMMGDRHFRTLSVDGFPTLHLPGRALGAGYGPVRVSLEHASNPYGPLGGTGSHLRRSVRSGSSNSEG